MTLFQLMVVIFAASSPSCFFGFQAEERDFRRWQAEMNMNLEAKERELGVARGVIQALRTKASEESEQKVAAQQALNEVLMPFQQSHWV